MIIIIITMGFRKKWASLSGSLVSWAYISDVLSSSLHLPISHIAHDKLVNFSSTFTKWKFRPCVCVNAFCKILPITPQWLHTHTISSTDHDQGGMIMFWLKHTQIHNGKGQMMAWSPPNSKLIIFTPLLVKIKIFCSLSLSLLTINTMFGKDYDELKSLIHTYTDYSKSCLKSGLCVSMRHRELFFTRLNKNDDEVWEDRHKEEEKNWLIIGELSTALLVLDSVWDAWHVRCNAHSVKQRRSRYAGRQKPHKERDRDPWLLSRERTPPKIDCD